MTTIQDEKLQQMLIKYFNGELDDATNEIIFEAACELTLIRARTFLAEITYSIGYSKSLMRTIMSEFTYSRLKKLCKQNIFKRLKEGNKI